MDFRHAGAHTIGQAQCLFFRSRIYNESNINSTFLTSLRSNCPRTNGSGDTNLSPTTFDNAYYTNLLSQQGAPALGPAALQRWQHRQHGPELRIQRVGVQQRVHGGDGEHGKHQPQDGLARVGGRKILPRNFLKKDGLARGDQAQMLQGELLEKRRRAHMHHSSKRQELIRSQYQFA
jgi:hypothetical protein